MLHLILCDDDSTVLKQYTAQLKQLAQKNQVELKISEFSSAESMLFSLEDPDSAADIVYLDVQMQGQDGITAAKQMRKLGSDAQLIFLTNSKESVFDSFDVRPLQYLLKGLVTDEKFEEVFLQAVSLSKERETERFVCERGSQRQAIPLSDIIYFEVTKRIVSVHYTEGVFEFYSSMDELEKDSRLKKRFVRTHRAFLVNLAKIRRLEQDSVGLSSGGEVPLGRTHARNVKEQLSRYLAGQRRIVEGGCMG